MTLIQPSNLSQDLPILLLIEDNPIALITLEHLVTQAGCCYVSAKDGEAGVEHALTHNFDLIITDLGLPGISGLEVTRTIREYEVSNNKPPVPIIGLTAHAEEALKQECLHSGMYEVTYKPMTKATLEELIKTYTRF